MASGQRGARSWGWVFTVLAVGACGGSVVHQGDHDDEGDPPVISGTGGSASGGRAQSSGGSTPLMSRGGHAGQSPTSLGGTGGDAGNGPYVPPHPRNCDGGRPAYSCDYSQEVVCSWQRVRVPDEPESGGTGPSDPCDAAEPLFDPSGAPQGGAGGDYPGRNACAGYVVVPVQQGDSLNCDVTYEDENKQCNILGHCCVLVDVKYCGP
jgi:hypothetical protein